MRGLEIPQYPGAGGPAVGGYPGGVAGVTGGGAGVGGGGGGLIGSGLRAPSVSTLTSSSPSLASTVQERSEAGAGQLTIQSGMKAICSNMQRQDSGLEVRDRMWLKINIPQAFIGEYSTKIVTP